MFTCNYNGPIINSTWVIIYIMQVLLIKKYFHKQAKKKREGTEENKKTNRKKKMGKWFPSLLSCNLLYWECSQCFPTWLFKSIGKSAGALTQIRLDEENRGYVDTHHWTFPLFNSFITMCAFYWLKVLSIMLV